MGFGVCVCVCMVCRVPLRHGECIDGILAKEYPAS